jgi:hypothetical protein
LPSIAHFLADLASEVLVYLQDLQRGFGDFAFGLRRCRDQLTALAVEPGRLALEGGEAIELDQILAPEFAHGGTPSELAFHAAEDPALLA